MKDEPEKKHPHNGEKDQRNEKKNREGNELPEISSVELDNIFFPELEEKKKKEDRSLGRDSRRIEIEEAAASPVPPFGRKSDESSKLDIRIEDATPLPKETSRPRPEIKPEPEAPKKQKRVPPRLKKIKPPSSVRRSPVQPPPPKKPVKKPVPKRKPEPAGENPLQQHPADVTRIFLPANRIDEHGKVIPLPKKKKESHKPDEFYAIMLQYGRSIHFRRTINFFCDYYNIDRISAQRRIRFGKGILFRSLDRATAEDLKKSLQAVPQDIHVVKETSQTVLPEPKEILVWLFSGRHFQVQTDKEKFVLSWKNVKLLCGGNVRLAGDSYKKVLDVTLSEPFMRIRIWDTTFNYKASGIKYDSLGNRNFLNLVKVLKKFTKGARFSPTLEEMLKQDLPEPKKFESPEEFDNYNQWLYFTFFGEPMR